MLEKATKDIKSNQQIFTIIPEKHITQTFSATVSPSVFSQITQVSLKPTKGQLSI